MAKSDGVSILDGMVAETLSAVGEKPKRSLSPLPGESGAANPLPQTPAPFPNDVPTEVVAQKIGELTRIIAHLAEARDALQLLIGQEPVMLTVVDATKQKEAAADAKAAASKRAQVAAAMADVNPEGGPRNPREDPPDPMPEGEGFPERFSALAKEAQDATFSKPAPTALPEGGWRCPVHPDAEPVGATSPKGRQFTRCSVVDCKQFEKR